MAALLPPSSRRPMNVMSDTHLNEQPRQDLSRDNGLGGQPLLSGYIPPSLGYTKVAVTTAAEMGSPQRGAMRPPISSSGSQDAHMEDDDDGLEESENESVTSDTNRPSKKKKGQRFFCTDFPPCNLSFTRSEHLARHIRKHTGERPFQCHCLRRFSRLDNLRQHAQTVHVNEDIPGDSLAATGTRFQRQIRTDRVRPPGSRSRAATINSQSSHGRGHSRNLSGSSIGSVASDMPMQEEYRRRPMPLAMAQNHTPRIPLTLDTLGATTTNAQPYDPQYYTYSSGFTTPTSVFSATSPGGSSGQSPMFTFPHAPTSQWGYHNRRLSVPVAPNPFQSPGHSRQHTISYMTPLQSSTASTFSESGTMNSPTGTAYHIARAEAAAAEADMRRRTWHPGTYAGYGPRPATSGLVNYQTPDAPEPVAAVQPAAAQVRLPGIDSFFDRAHAHPVAPTRGPVSPMDVEQSQRLKHPREVAASDTSSRRDSWDSMSHNLHQLNIAQNTPPREKAVPRSVTFNAPPPVIGRLAPSGAGSQPVLQHAQVRQTTVAPTEPDVKLADPPLTPRRAKRQAWYNGPVAPAADTQPTLPHLQRSPGPSNSDTVHTSAPQSHQYHSTTTYRNGHFDPHTSAMSAEDAQKAYTLTAGQQRSTPLQPLAPRSPRHNARGSSNTDRLDALVAVATSGGQMNMPIHNPPV